MTLDRLMSPDTIVVNGVDSCEDTTRARARLDTAGLPYRYVDLDQDGAARAGLHDRGLTATPVVITPAGEVLVEPSDPELEALIAAHLGRFGA